ncbi:MAG: hypothetical protein K8R56_03325 [Candidatus Eisenbacteria bacterium]|nr:hypothetical protein [Candidatus Eisenbacteria bacterium]
MNPSSRAALLALAALAVFASGCGKSKSATAPEPVTSRTVTIELRDSTGAAMSGIIVWTAAADGLTIFGGATDAQGHRTMVMPVGASVVATVNDIFDSVPGALVAGGTFNVPGDSRPAADTIMVRLVATTGSLITGVVHRPGSPVSDSGLAVSAPDYLATAFDISHPDGKYSFGRIPPGDWRVTYSDFTARLGATQVVHVPATPSIVVADPITVAALAPGTPLRARPLTRRFLR